MRARRKARPRWALIRPWPSRAVRARDAQPSAAAGAAAVAA
jgi:hypothetical protein